MHLQKILSELEEIYMENWRLVLKPKVEAVLKERDSSTASTSAPASQKPTSTASAPAKHAPASVAPAKSAAQAQSRSTSAASAPAKSAPTAQAQSKSTSEASSGTRANTNHTQNGESADSCEDEQTAVPSFLSKNKASGQSLYLKPKSNLPQNSPQSSSQNSTQYAQNGTKGLFPPPKETTIVMDYTANIHIILIPKFDTDELKNFKAKSLDKNQFKSFSSRYGPAWMLYKGAHECNMRVINSYKFPYNTMTKAEYESEDRDAQIIEKYENKPRYKLVKTTENEYNNQVNNNYVYIKLAGLSENLCVGIQNTKLDASKPENKGLKSVFALDSDDKAALKKDGIRVFDVQDSEVVALAKKWSVYTSLVALKMGPLKGVDDKSSSSSSSRDSSDASCDEDSSSNTSSEKEDSESE